MPKIIKTDEDHRAALAEAERLMGLDPQPGTPEAEELELVAFLIAKYERERFPIAKPDPIDALEFRMDQQRLTARDLIPYLGGRSKVSEILARKRPLTLSMVRALSEGLGIPAEILIKDPQPAVAITAETAEELAKYPLQEMRQRGWIGDSLKSARDFILSLSVEESPMLCRRTESVRAARSMDLHALHAWRTRVVSVARAMDVGRYRKGVVSAEFMRQVAQASAEQHGPRRAQQLLAKAGIPLVVEPHLSRTYLDGATILWIKDRPVIGLTVRHDRLDNFWFTLMHELAHIHLHADAETEFFDDLDVESVGDPREREADHLAGEVLIPDSVWRMSAAARSKIPDAAGILAKQLHIHVSIVAGRMRRHWKQYRMLNNLVGHYEVRREFPNINWPE